MLAQALNVICGGLMLIYGHIRAQKQSYGPATLTITGKAISVETRLPVVTALNSIMRGAQCEKVVRVHFPLPLTVFEPYMSHSANASHHIKKNTIVHTLKTKKK